MELERASRIHISKLLKININEKGRCITIIVIKVFLIDSFVIIIIIDND